MNNKPFFSVIMPAFNCQNYISDAIESVLNQDFVDFELIIIDDGSTDETSTICDKYASNNEKIRTFHIKNSGPYNARKVGINQAKGLYCAFIDSDDLFCKELLSTAYKTISDESCQIVLFNLSFFRNTVDNQWKSKPLFDELKKEFNSDNKDALQTLLLTSNRLNNLVTKIIDIKLLKVDCEYHTFNYLRGEDLLQSICPILAATKIVYIDKYLYLYRQTETSISKRISKKPSDVYKSFSIELFEIKKSVCEKYNCCVQIDDIIRFHFIDVLRYFYDAYRCYDSKNRKELLLCDWRKVFSNDAIERLYDGSLKVPSMVGFQVKSILAKSKFRVDFFLFLRKLKGVFYESCK